MAVDRRTHRSHVSYIDKSRNYYGAQGYPQPYQWAYNHDVPFASPKKPLSECRLGLVTTSFFERKVDETATAGAGTKEPYAALCDEALGGLYNKDLFWDKDTTHTEDLDTYLPIKCQLITAIEELVAETLLKYWSSLKRTNLTQ